VYDVATGETTLISRTPEGQPANNDSFYPSISRDGTLVAYTSLASDLSEDGAGARYYNIYLYDSATGSNRLISTTPDGSMAEGNSDRADISVDGTHIGYESDANNLVSGDTDADRHPVDVFLYRLS
jgi:Tol biopolymer transport system component